MAVFIDDKLYGLEDMSIDDQVEHLTKLCRSESEAGRLGHWTYHPARHREYLALLKRAMAARDIEAIDKAFERAGQRILEAAE